MQLWKLIVPVAMVAGLAFVAANCSDSNEGQPDAGWANQQEEEVPVACDPDGLAPCPSTFFTCTEDSYGGKTCEEEAPVPGGGDWECRQQGTTLICDGPEMPADGGGDWVCEENEDGTVTCTRHAYIPQGGGDGVWDCEYDGEFRVCEYTPGGSDDGADADSDSDGDTDSDSDIPGGGGDGCPPGVEVPTDELCGDDVDNDCDGFTDETCPDWENPPCVCIPGAWRYCDTPDYCLWGTQVCNEDGMDWGPCLEVREIPSECAEGDGWYSPAASACCIGAGFCCQDMWDINHNGDFWESLGNCTDILCVPEEMGGE